MNETVIRGKTLTFLLFAVMILFSIHAQRQQESSAAAAKSSARTAEGSAAAAKSSARTAESSTSAAESSARTAESGTNAAKSSARTAEGSAAAAKSSARTAEGNAAAAESSARTAEKAQKTDAPVAREDGWEGECVDEELPGRIALTFDDGPHPRYTKILLDGLRERGVKATFFVIGKNILGCEELIAQMAKDGHMIGNHTYDHTDISALSEEAACEELQKTCDLVQEITGNATPYVRAPFGKWSDALDGKVSMIAVGWTVDPMDWTTRNTAQIVKSVVTNVTDNDIILLHDYYQSSVEAALQIVDELQARGFQFVTVEDLMLE